MHSVSGPELVAAVCNAGGVGVLGATTLSPSRLAEKIDGVRALLHNKNAAFGVDIMVPKIGDGARKTNVDYTAGSFPLMIKVLVEKRVAIAITAVGIPDARAIETLRRGGVKWGNMCGSAKHARAALRSGADLLIAQGMEAGGHVGTIGSFVLTPLVVDATIAHAKATGAAAIPVLLAGGVFDGRGLAAAMALGAAGVWVGTAFVVAKESRAGPSHRTSIVEYNELEDDTRVTTAYTGRPCRVRRDAYNAYYSTAAGVARLAALQAGGHTAWDVDTGTPGENPMGAKYPLLMGQSAAGVKAAHSNRRAADIIDDIMGTATRVIRDASISSLKAASKL